MSQTPASFLGQMPWRIDSGFETEHELPRKLKPSFQTKKVR